MIVRYGVLIKSFAIAPALGDIRRNPPRLIFAEQLGRRSPTRLILEIDIS